MRNNLTAPNKRGGNRSASVGREGKNEGRDFGKAAIA